MFRSKEERRAEKERLAKERAAERARVLQEARAKKRREEEEKRRRAWEATDHGRAQVAYDAGEHIEKPTPRAVTSFWRVDSRLRHLVKSLRSTCLGAQPVRAPSSSCGLGLPGPPRIGKSQTTATLIGEALAGRTDCWCRCGGGIPAETGATADGSAPSGRTSSGARTRCWRPCRATSSCIRRQPGPAPVLRRPRGGDSPWQTLQHLMLSLPSPAPTNVPISQRKPPPTPQKSSVRESDRPPLGGTPSGRRPLCGSASQRSRTNLQQRRTPADPGHRLSSRCGFARSRSRTSWGTFLSESRLPENTLPGSWGQVFAHSARNGHGSRLHGMPKLPMASARAGQQPSVRAQKAYRIPDFGHGLGSSGLEETGGRSPPCVDSVVAVNDGGGRGAHEWLNGSVFRRCRPRRLERGIVQATGFGQVKPASADAQDDQVAQADLWIDEVVAAFSAERVRVIPICPPKWDQSGGQTSLPPCSAFPSVALPPAGGDVRIQASPSKSDTLHRHPTPLILVPVTSPPSRRVSRCGMTHPLHDPAERARLPDPG